MRNLVITLMLIGTLRVTAEIPGLEFSKRFAWDDNADPVVSSYEIGYGVRPGEYPTVVNTAGRFTSIQLSAFVEGITYYVAVRAVLVLPTTTLYSDWSDEITFSKPLSGSVILIIQKSVDLKTWVDVLTHTYREPADKQFYRIQIQRND